MDEREARARALALSIELSPMVTNGWNVDNTPEAVVREVILPAAELLYQWIAGPHPSPIQPFDLQDARLLPEDMPANYPTERFPQYRPPSRT